jgi:hypothetical protein
MRVGLIDVDSHNFPNLALMKISAWHKAQGDDVEWWFGFHQYDRVYMSKVFDNTYTPDVYDPVNTKEIIKGGTGYFRRNRDNEAEVFADGRWCNIGVKTSFQYGNTVYTEALPCEIEHMYPDYSLYPELTKDTAYGFLTRGCPNNCPFCIVSAKEGRKSYKVADLSEWWNGQKHIVLLDPNILGHPGHMDLLRQLAESKAYVDFNQGLDARFLNEKNIRALNLINTERIHFAWDLMKNSDMVIEGLLQYIEYGKIKDPARRVVYVLTNFDSSMDENLYRIYKLVEMHYDPYVMVFDKPNAPKEIRRLQRWCNNRRIFKSCPRFEDYKG